MRTESKRFLLAALVPLLAVTTGCKDLLNADDLNTELAEAAGDALMDGIDDTSFNAMVVRRVENAERATCDSVTYAACDTVNNTRLKTFGGCTNGTRTFNGTVLLTWVDTNNDCSVDTAGNTVSRAPDYTVTGAHGWTVTVKTSGTVGQRLTMGSAGSATYGIDGIRRTAKDAKGNTIADLSTKTTEAIHITYDSGPRVGRVVDGGKLQMDNLVSGNTCTVVPNALTWTGDCTCADSGNITGTCTDGSTFTVDIKSCGTVDVTVGAFTTKGVTLGRCEALPGR